MFISIALCALASSPVQATPTTLPTAGFLRDARAELHPDNHLVFDAQIQWPATITRRSFVVEGIAADGSVRFARPVTASVPAITMHRPRRVHASFDLVLPALEGVQELRVRLAQ